MGKLASVPRAYQYANLLKQHLFTVRGRSFKPFDGVATLPRQLEVHVPNEGKSACNANCIHCQGQMFDRPMRVYDDKLFSLIDNLGGSVPFFILSGDYSEPTLNRRLIEFVELIKRTGASFGLHTNGIQLDNLEKDLGFLRRLYAVSGSKDYISIAIDAGREDSFAETKQVGPNPFQKILRALETLCYLRKSGDRSALHVRVTYLLNEWNSSPYELELAVSLMKRFGVDSLRFSIPYAPFGLPIDDCRNYKLLYEKPLYDRVWQRLAPLFSKRQNERPSIFGLAPDLQDIDAFSFSHCFIGYYMATIGADGNFYRCSPSAHPAFTPHRLGTITPNIETFQRILLKNQDGKFDPQVHCFPNGARCNRFALEINRVFENRHFK